MNFQEQFEKETKTGEYTKTNDPETYWKSYAKWLEQSLRTGQVDAIVNRLGFKEWLRQVTQLDSRLRHLLHQDLPYYEFSDWIDWYDDGLTPEQAISENQRQYG